MSLGALTEAKVQAKFALESLISQCAREIRHLEEFDDSRLLIATGDLQRSVDYAMEKAQQLEETYETVASKDRRTTSCRIVDEMPEYDSSGYVVDEIEEDNE